MNRFPQLIALATLAFAGAAMADDATVVVDDFTAQKSRAEVRAEVLKAQAEGTLRIQDVDTSSPKAEPSAVTREQVRAELRTPKARIAYPEAA
jgi:hypothetical protein